MPGLFLFRGAIYMWMLLITPVYVEIPYKVISIKFHDSLQIAHQHLTDEHISGKKGHCKGSKDIASEYTTIKNLDTDLSHINCKHSCLLGNSSVFWAT